ncbi:hypothetical protein HANVADRAFT_22812 [Hanseniaspora valbyensis NRRL Y-1626]|uniref:Vacuolar protein sorting-associated protein 74 n=1 Tax=Hanseniaspora valbyensis NRRL Y-1626 TaxID=766949 RepID=A0A1B7TGD2_9ASCO|nr:hypothetical protein HANVADRAFT_22812 [Hanseniaspora valbyensis NRRL Y-1626]
MIHRRGGRKKDDEENENYSDSEIDSINNKLSNVKLSSTSKKEGNTKDTINSTTKSSTQLVIPELTLMEEVVLLGLKSDGMLSFWNDNISYALRGLILIELALRKKIRIIDEPARKRYDLSERLIEVVDNTKTGEFLLDESLNLMSQDNVDQQQSITSWIDLLSGETWNLMKINYQLKQVRERICKELADKGVLRTEMKNYFLFDVVSWPIVDQSCKDNIKRRVMSALVNRNLQLTYNKYFPENTTFQSLRTICLVAGAQGSNVLERVLQSLEYEKRDKGFERAQELCEQFGKWPFDMATGTKTGVSVNVYQVIEEEMKQNPGCELYLEVIAGVLEVFAGMESVF